MFFSARDLFGEVVLAHLDNRVEGREPDSFARFAFSKSWRVAIDLNGNLAVF